MASEDVTMNERKRKAPPPSSTSSVAGRVAEEGPRKKRLEQEPDVTPENGSAPEQADQADKEPQNAAETTEFSIAQPTAFVKRGVNRFVPLIAIDELPSHITIHGVLPAYTMEDVEELQGQIIMAPKRASPWPVDVDQTKIKSENGGSPRGRQVPSRQSIHDRLAAAFGPHGPNMAPRRGPTAATTTTQRYNPTTPGVLGQKVYCTHWMRTGECDFTQQGCMFLHCMPDLDTLEKLGFRSYPRWFREMPRQYQEENSNDFDANGLNPNQISMREMQQSQQQNAMAPPPPPPPTRSDRRSENTSLYGMGRNASSTWSSGGSNGFAAFQPHGNASVASSEVGRRSERNGSADEVRLDRSNRSERSISGRSAAPSISGPSLLSRESSPSRDSVVNYRPLTPATMANDFASTTSETASTRSKYRSSADSKYKAPDRSVMDSKDSISSQRKESKPDIRMREGTEEGELKY